MNNDMATKITAKADVASGDTLDLQGAEACALILNTIATTEVELEEGDASDGSDAAAVDAAFIIVGDDNGALSGNVVTYDDAVSAVVGYVGKKRYLTVTVTNPAVDDTIVLVKGELHDSPAE